MATGDPTTCRTGYATAAYPQRASSHGSARGAISASGRARTLASARTPSHAINTERIARNHGGRGPDKQRLPKKEAETFKNIAAPRDEAVQEGPEGRRPGAEEASGARRNTREKGLVLNCLDRKTKAYVMSKKV